MISFDPYLFTEQLILERVQKIKADPSIVLKEETVLPQILGMIDLTTLEGSDTTEKIRKTCEKAAGLSHTKPGIPNVAAVCFYPVFTRSARNFLEGSGVKVAAVAGAFPSGQSPLSVKLSEVKYALGEGAEEIDMVISRGKLLEGNETEVFDEIAAIKDLCGNITLKVILETGELDTIARIRKASELAINAGADFLKTSTGKIATGATPEAVLVMLDSVREAFEKSGRITGVKVSGGVANSEQALVYYKLVLSVAGEKWNNKSYFRIGASRLVDDIISKLG